MVKKTKQIRNKIILKPSYNKCITKNRKVSTCKRQQKLTIVKGCNQQSSTIRPSLRRRTLSIKTPKQSKYIELEYKFPSAFQKIMGSMKKNRNMYKKNQQAKLNKITESLTKLLK